MKILTPLDQSARDGVVLPYSTKLARALEATLVLVHAVSTARSLLPRALRQGEAYVTAAQEGLREQGLTVEGFVLRGDPATAILTIATELEVDLIVMATRGRQGLTKLVLGSIADAVLAHCQTPVLLVSEATDSAPVDEQTKLQSAYLATVIWHKQAAGLLTPEEAERELDRLARASLDRAVLFSTYHAEAERGATLPWLDIGFQVSTLRRFLPQDVPRLEAGAPTDGEPKRMAA